MGQTIAIQQLFIQLLCGLLDPEDDVDLTKLVDSFLASMHVYQKHQGLEKTSFKISDGKLEFLCKINTKENKDIYMTISLIKE